MEESDQHLAAGECGKEVIFVTMNGGCSFIPKMVAIEEDMVDGVSVTTVRAGGVIVGTGMELG